MKLKSLNCVLKCLEILAKDWEGGISAINLFETASSATINQTAGLFKLQNARNDYAILNMYVDIIV